LASLRFSPSFRCAAVALGSNLGDRLAHLHYAIRSLESILPGLRASTFIETEPFGIRGTQPPFLNAVVVGGTTLEPRMLLERLLAIEGQRGRVRPFPLAPRTLDLDLILLGDLIVDESDLQVPHPRFRDRLFVLGPLAEVAPGMVDPVTGIDAAGLLRVAEESARKASNPSSFDAQDEAGCCGRSRMPSGGGGRSRTGRSRAGSRTA
jgi:2-amino-4-hydroxy-6-hydroxymethyldihydropteridine diphosphokinase